MTMDTRARLDDVRVFIATPAYGGLVTTDYMHSLMAMREHLDTLGAVSRIYTIASESLVTRARNACVARFMAATVDGQPFTHLAFIDADLGFPPWALERLLRLGEPLAAAAYPLKHIDFQRLAELASAGDLPGDPDELRQRATGYPLVLELPTRTRDDFIAVLSVGTGFMCIARSAIEQLLAAHGTATRYENDIPGYTLPGQGYDLDPGALRFHDLFAAGVDPDTRSYLSEDYAFCKRWRALGGTVWVDLRARLTHVGAHRHEGDVATWLESIGAIARVRPPG